MNERINYKYLENDSAIQEEIMTIFNSEDIYDENAISLYDVLKTVQVANKKYELAKEEYQDYFESLLKREFGSPKVSNLKADGYKRELSMEFTPNYQDYRPFKKITFAENDYGIYIKEDKTGYGKYIYRVLNKEIINCYMDLLSCSRFLDERKENIRPLNSSFYVNVDKFGVRLSVSKKKFNDDFHFTAYSGFGLYDVGQYDCNQKLSRTFELILNNENNFLKKIFVEIEDCPDWSKRSLYKRRDKQLNPGLLKSKILKLKNVFK